jgi:hypothetical protein
MISKISKSGFVLYDHNSNYSVLIFFKSINKFPLRSHGTSLGAIYSFGSLGFRLLILLPFPSF